MWSMFWLYTGINLFTVGIFYAVYGGRRRFVYSEGKLLGVHLPESAAKGEEVTAFMERYRRRSGQFYLWNTIAGVLICFLNFWYISIFMIVWSVWLTEMCGGAIAMLYRTHRKLYDLKVERGWIGSGGSRIMAADTRASAEAGRTGVSPWWHLVCLFLILMPLLLPSVRAHLREAAADGILLASGAMISVLFLILQKVILRNRNKVYSEESELNLQINRMQKNVWCWALIGGDIFNVAACLTAAQYMDAKGWLSTGVYMVYTILESIPALFLLGGYLYIARKKRNLLTRDEKPLYLDDDVYWKNGWYSNPHDRSLLVQDWVCSWNYATNMARPAAKVCLVLAAAVIGIGLPALCAVMLRLDFTPIELRAGETKVEITSGDSDLTLGYDEILGVQVLEELPEDDYTRSRGVSDGRQLQGRFRGKETGRCRMYLYVGYEPLLEIRTEEGPVYINSKTDGEVEEWYRQIVGRLE